MCGLMADSKLRIIQSYEQGLVPMGSDKQGPTVKQTHAQRLGGLLAEADTM